MGKKNKKQMKRQLADAASDRHASHAQLTVPGSLFLAFSLAFFVLPSQLFDSDQGDKLFN